MKYLILLSLIVFINNCDAQDKNNADTLNTLFYKSGRQINDTTYFESNSSQTTARPELLRFFLKMLHIQEDSNGSPVLGKCKIYFIIDKSGRVTQIWYDKSSNVGVALEVIRVINRLPIIKPSSVNGNPVITKVEMTVAALQEDEYGNKIDDSIADIVMTYAVMRRKKIIN